MGVREITPRRWWFEDRRKTIGWYITKKDNKVKAITLFGAQFARFCATSQ